jgi:hypothetical protein
MKRDEMHIKKIELVAQTSSHQAVKRAAKIHQYHIFQLIPDLDVE